MSDISDQIRKTTSWETMEDYNNIKDAIQDYFDIIDGNPFLPSSIKTQFQNALNCFNY